MLTARRRSRVQTLMSTDIAAYMRFRAQIFTLTEICPRTIIMENPFPYSDTNRRFYTYDYYMRRQFGAKCAKIPIDGGFTCPNIDGTVGVGGCAYCALASDGHRRDLRPLGQQYEEHLSALRRKWEGCLGVPYFQDYTCTYAPTTRLRELYEQALALPGAVGMHIATRADCLPEPVLDLLSEVNDRTHLVVELGLQTVHDETARRIGRGHDYAAFLRGYESLRERGIRVCVHIINGLPGEDREMMLETARELARLHVFSVKIHLLHIMRGTRLADRYAAGEFSEMSLEDYALTVVSQLELLPTETVIGRVTGDGAADGLIAPLWSRKKFVVMNEIDKELVRRGSMQGSRYAENAGEGNAAY